MKSLRKRHSWTAILPMAILSGLAQAPSVHAAIIAPLVQTTNPPPHSHPTDDVPFRHEQLESLSNEAERPQREAARARELALRAVHERNDRLNFDAQKILQLSMDLNKSMEQSQDASSADRVQIAQKLEKLAHEVRTTLANRGVPHPDPSKEKGLATPASRDELLLQSRRCVQLAMQLKQHVDEMLDPQNQHTVSAAALKAPKGKDKQPKTPSPIMSTAENLENLSYRIGHSL